MQTSSDRESDARIAALIRRYNENSKSIERLREEVVAGATTLYAIAHGLGNPSLRRIPRRDVQTMERLPGIVDALLQALADKAQMDTDLRNAGLERIIC